MSDPKTLDADTFRFSVEPRIASPFHDSATDHIVDAVDGRVVAVFDAHDRAVAVQEALEGAHDATVACRHALGEPTNPVPLTSLGDAVREAVAAIMTTAESKGAKALTVIDALRAEVARQTGNAADHCARADAEANRAAEMEAQAQREQARADAAEQMVAELRAIISSRRPDPDSVLSADAAVDVLDDIVHALSRTEAVAGRWVHEDEIIGVEMVDRMRAERDAAIAARDEAVAAFERSGAKGLVAMAQRDAAERARDEVGIQLAAAQAEIARWSPVVQYASNVHHCYREGYDLVKPMAALGGAIAALDAVPGDALAPRITAALEASGIDASNVKGGE